jgi:hypothetical protein
MTLHLGRFLIHIPIPSRRRDRIRTVGRAAFRVAEMLHVDVEVREKDNVDVVWVYYDSGNKKAVLYHDWSRGWDEDYIFKHIKDDLYAKSFLPEHTELQGFRGVLA